jgi:hypothetical protein
VHNHTHGKRCYNCDDFRHFSNDCPDPKRQREHLRAAHMIVGGEDTDEEKKEERMNFQLGSQHGNDRSSTSVVAHDDESHIIKVSASEFYEETVANHEFLASLHAFPLKELKNVVDAPTIIEALMLTKGDSLDRNRVAAGMVVTPSTIPAHLVNKKYQF